MSETIPVRFEVGEIEPTPGCGELLATATVIMAVHDVEIMLRGCQIRISKGRYAAGGPTFKDPKTGKFRDSLLLQPALADAFGRALVEVWENPASWLLEPLRPAYCLPRATP